MNSLKKFDQKYYTKKIKLIAGVDEAGRGPLAGPVVAAAVIFNNKSFHPEITDSKKLSEQKRNYLYKWIIENSLSYSVCVIDNFIIDEINILQASLKAMKIAVENLSIAPDLILIDGNKTFQHSTKLFPIVKGDSKSFSIAAASIIAKVTRDKIMNELSNDFPNYDWAKNKGYATKKHREAIIKFGETIYHRKTFLKKLYSQKQQIEIFNE
ncbi:MAG: ribonuclease HII [Stygiobacter sp.]|jgi:ribonuclease HII|uniref:Ribonuclease HII n=1 Tax=Stygiobacter electus TaxID=3032292 RepID=A0AAE3NZ41_9BACT|nr:ribonuclease HII [Stygiobacter electus]MDF1611139.1 ribonuclease HII [Stygiobacter electus]